MPSLTRSVPKTLKVPSLVVGSEHRKAAATKAGHSQLGTFRGFGTERVRLGTFRGFGTECTLRGFGTERARLGPFRGFGTERARLGTFLEVLAQNVQD